MMKRNISSWIKGFLRDTLEHWIYYMTPFSHGEKIKGRPFRWLKKYFYLILSAVIILSAIASDCVDGNALPATTIATVLLLAMGGILVKRIMGYKEMDKPIWTFSEMFRDGQDDLLKRIDSYFSAVPPRSLDSNQGKALALLIYVENRRALKPQVVSEVFFIDKMMAKYGDKFKKRYPAETVQNAKRAYVYREEIGRGMGLR
jgi:hypothetical protein